MLEQILNQDTRWQRQDGRAYPMGSAIGATLPPGTSWERREPARPADLVGDVAVPLAQSAITGAIGLAVGAVIGGPMAGLATGGLTFGASWLILLVDHRRGLWLVERLTGVDIDQNGSVGKPSTVTVEVIERKRKGGSIRYAKLPVGDDKLKAVARECIEKGTAFSRPALSASLTQTEYHKLAAAMVDAGLVHELPGNKRELSAAGRTLLTQLLD